MTCNNVQIDGEALMDLDRTNEADRTNEGLRRIADRYAAEKGFGEDEPDMAAVMPFDEFRSKLRYPQPKPITNAAQQLIDHLAGCHTVDLDGAGHVLGFEILDASQFFEAEKAPTGPLTSVSLPDESIERP